jgi:uncharacterized protein YdaU (DUF1376 family)
MYPADFEAKTSHLTLEEDGAYNRLLRLCWMTPECSLPDDEAWLARRMRVSVDDFARVVKPLLEEFFETKKGRIYSPRLSEEWEKVSETYIKRSAAGKKGGRPKAVENKQKEQKVGLSPAKAGPKQPEPEPEPEEKRSSEDKSSEDLSTRARKPPAKKTDEAEARRILAAVAGDGPACDFLAHRKAKRAPLTALAAELIAAKLAAHPAPAAVLADSIMNGWTGVFPDRATGPPRPAHQPFDTAAAFARAFPDLQLDPPQ